MKITVLTLHVAIVGDIEVLPFHQYDEVTRVGIGNNVWECNGVVTAVRPLPQFIANEVAP